MSKAYSKKTERWTNSARNASTTSGSPPMDGPLKPGKVPPMYRRVDWFTFAVTALLSFFGYLYTLAPDLTLQDSGELAVASYYAGVPHPPGYPVWTLYTWLFTVLVPISNIAWRVALSSAFAAAVSCGLIGLMVSRGSSMLMEGIDLFKGIERKWEDALCAAAGFVAGMLLAFNGFMWSQAVIVEVYTLSILSLTAVLCMLLRWVYAPHQVRYLYWAFFLSGICFTNHMTLIVAAIGIEVVILLARPDLGRNVFLGNTVVWLGVVILKAFEVTHIFEANQPLYVIFNVIGILSAVVWVWSSYLTRKSLEDWIPLGRDILLGVGGIYLIAMFLLHAGLVQPEKRGVVLFFVHAIGIGSLAYIGYHMVTCRNLTWKLFPHHVQVAVVYLGIYLFLVFVTSYERFDILKANFGVFALHHVLGAAAFLVVYLYFNRQGGLGNEIQVLVIGSMVWILGASFYFYMPVASMTNPPMNWGYPRTVEGFFHALTRGQYEKANPTDNFWTFINQVRMYIEGAIDEFTMVYLLIGLLPLVFFKWMKRRERAWIGGLFAIYICLALILLIVLNPGLDRQSRELNKVFFTSSHVMIAMGIGYGLAMLGGLLRLHYEQFRLPGMYGAGVAAGIALYGLANVMMQVRYPLMVYTALFGLALALAAVAMFFFARHRLPLQVFLVIILLMPIYSVMSHWSNNEQRGHLFGYWFGHDMFTPPFEDETGEPIYPEMARNAILFGGTDPGRFCPTYMIFCESFIPPEDKPRDPDFDRRDVYIITQNALADHTYLSYIRAHYNRSTQKDPPFFQELFRTEKDRATGTTNFFARSMAPVDEFFLELGERIEQERRRQGVYPAEEIYCPTPLDSQKTFEQYITDAGRRLQMNQLRPGENVTMGPQGQVQVSGQVSVMAINGLLTKLIFDKNPDHEFYVEESFPLDWMYPYLKPYGIIMKINRQPVEEITEAMVKDDHLFWKKYSERLCGDVVSYDTPIKEITDFVQRVYRRRDLEGYTGDDDYIRDQDAQKAFSKLRSAIAGLYTWRINNAKTGAEQQRMIKEADFAFRQAFAFCPYSPEAVFRYANLLVSLNRMEEALLIAETSFKFDPENPALLNLIHQLEGMIGQQSSQVMPPPETLDQDLTQYEQRYQENPNNLTAAAELIAAYLQMRRKEDAERVVDELLSRPNLSPEILLTAAQAYAQVGRMEKLEATLERLIQMDPENPEAWFDLAAVRVAIAQEARVTNNPQFAQQMIDSSIEALSKSIQLSKARKQRQPTANDLVRVLKTDPRFESIRDRPEIQALLSEE